MKPQNLISAIILSACFATVGYAQDRPRIVAVNYALQYFAERLAGEDAEVVFPVPTNADPSFWRPSIADISMIQSADLILLNGAGFASWVDRVSLPRSKLVNTSSSIEDRFIATETITHSHGDGGEHTHEGIASYTWLDPSLAIAQAEVIADAVAARGLADSDDVELRLADLRTDLEALDMTARSALIEAAGIPIIATHPRYQYFARRYGLSISALEWEAGVTPSSAQISELRAIAAQSGAPILIWEAEPTAEAVAAVEELGIASVIFPPMARSLQEGNLLEVFEAAVSALADEVRKQSEN